MKNKLKISIKNKQSFIALFVLLAIVFNACENPSGSNSNTDSFTPTGYYVDSKGSVTETDSGRTVVMADKNAKVVLYSDNTASSAQRIGFTFDDKIIIFVFEKSQNFPRKIILSDSEETYNGVITPYDSNTQTYSLTLDQGSNKETMANIALNKDIFTQYKDNPELTASQNLRMRNLHIAMCIYKSMDDFITLGKTKQARGTWDFIGKVAQKFFPGPVTKIVVGTIAFVSGATSLMSANPVSMVSGISALTDAAKMLVDGITELAPLPKTSSGVGGGGGGSSGGSSSGGSTFVSVTAITGVPTGGITGTPIALSGSVEPANATNKTIAWSVKSPGTTGASISGNTLTTTAAGTVAITATIANGQTASTPYTQDFYITIANTFVPVTGITGVPSVASEGTLYLSVTVAPTNATNKAITWSVKSAGTTNATISGNTLTTRAGGTVTITATIANGRTASTPYTQDFSITITGSGGSDPGVHTHLWGAWNVTKPATCTEEGEEKRVCTLDSSHFETRKIAINPSAHNWVQLTGTPATCTTAGTGKRRCSICSIEETSGVLPALGHNWGSWVSTATFITGGEEKRTCRNDPSHTETREADSLLITSRAEWEAAIAQLNGKTGNYVLNVDVTSINSTSFGTTPSGTLCVTLKGNRQMTVDGPSSTGVTMFRVGNNQKLIIDGLSLQGKNTRDDKIISCTNGGTVELRSGEIKGSSADYGVGVGVYGGTFTMYGGKIYNSGYANVDVSVDGTFTMYGGEITHNYKGPGVNVDKNGTFTMDGGEISGNSSGGVTNKGTFTMNGGEICSNTSLASIANTFDPSNPSVSSSAGGVYNSGTFTMNGGEIYSNTTASLNSTSSGGGVYNNGTFIMNNGKIYDNRATIQYTSNRTECRTQGGGIFNFKTFTMYGGEIYGNKAMVQYVSETFAYGGGVYNIGGATFSIITGTIYGSNDPSKANLASNENGGALYNSGIARYGNGSGTWTSLSTTDATIKVVNGVKQ